ncbi:TetR/AcrR family transcriptional regulator [Bacillus sp. FJAT-50079]|uniref:TetR/AcrR family transcriptional regulator n=1 Tax=Bacillus sp. FJAT-50079 TaxID=2833577 RepID=UPI001BC967B7|nr:TetR/AcrR family transcriptional regulator [Bacillus sp. FJAT-50079]MBS4207045.1 TetR family transcriptional regulator [Bacillus sp. FJAT-50079]
MPKVTFFNLPDDKKQSLINAAKKEFSRVPLFEASIANIVKEAGIPRGSFYQYFEDKEDAFFFLLNELTEENKKYFVFTLEKHKGDLFEAMLEFFAIIINEEENFQFLRNTFLNMTHKIESTFAKSFGDREITLNDIGLFINTSNLNISKEAELFHVMKIITSVTIRNVVDKFALEIPYEEAMTHYTTEMNLLKNGLLKGE